MVVDARARMIWAGNVFSRSRLHIVLLHNNMMMKQHCSLFFNKVLLFSTHTNSEKSTFSWINTRQKTAYMFVHLRPISLLSLHLCILLYPFDSKQNFLSNNSSKFIVRWIFCKDAEKWVSRAQFFEPLHIIYFTLYVLNAFYQSLNVFNYENAL